MNVGDQNPLFSDSEFIIKLAFHFSVLIHPFFCSLSSLLTSSPFLQSLSGLSAKCPSNLALIISLLSLKTSNGSLLPPNTKRLHSARGCLLSWPLCLSVHLIPSYTLYFSFGYVPSLSVCRSLCSLSLSLPFHHRHFNSLAVKHVNPYRPLASSSKNSPLTTHTELAALAFAFP